MLRNCAWKPDLRSVSAKDEAVCCRTRQRIVTGVILRRPAPGELGDRYAALSQLWIQLHRNLSVGGTAAGEDPPGGLWPLQVNPLVVADLLAPTHHLILA